MRLELGGLGERILRVEVRRKSQEVVDLATIERGLTEFPRWRDVDLANPVPK